MPQVLPSPTVPHIHKSPGNINFPRLNASPTRFPAAISSTAPNVVVSGPVGIGGATSADALQKPHATAAKKLSKASSTQQIWLPGTDRPDSRKTRHLSHIDLPRDYDDDGSMEGQAWIQRATSSSSRPKPPPSAAASLPRGFKQSQVLDVDKIFGLPPPAYRNPEVKVERNSDSDDEDDDGEWC